MQDFKKKKELENVIGKQAPTSFRSIQQCILLLNKTFVANASH